MVVRMRTYRPEDEKAWLSCWGRVVVTSHAWGLAYQAKPRYSRPSVELVVVDEQDSEPNSIVGFIDVEIEDRPGELGGLADSRCGFVWEFGLLPSYRRRGLGRALLDEAAEALSSRGVGRMEFWSMDREAQGFYAHVGMREISRHWRFWVRLRSGDLGRPDLPVIRPEYLHATCGIEEWDEVRRCWDIITDPPFEPHECLGFDYRLPLGAGV